jgi:hypothetical protein
MPPRLLFPFQVCLTDAEYSVGPTLPKLRVAHASLVDVPAARCQASGDLTSKLRDLHNAAPLLPPGSLENASSVMVPLVPASLPASLPPVSLPPVSLSLPAPVSTDPLATPTADGNSVNHRYPPIEDWKLITMLIPRPTGAQHLPDAELIQQGNLGQGKAGEEALEAAKVFLPLSAASIPSFPSETCSFSHRTYHGHQQDVE